MENKDVLILEAVPVFDLVAVRIAYQDTSVLKRGEFKDEELDIYSEDSPELSVYDMLFIQGNEKNLDNGIMIMTKTQYEKISERVKKLNEKYSKRIYFTINNAGKVEKVEWKNNRTDKELFEIGNFFFKYEDADKMAKEYKAMLLANKGGLCKCK